MKKLTTQEYIEKAISIHGKKYDYSKVNYVGATSKVEIVCPIHGSFFQQACSHLRGYGCIKCSSVGAPKLKFEDFITKLNKRFGDRYLCHEDSFKSSGAKASFECKLHGEFKCSPSDMLGRVHGCPKCAKEASRKFMSLTQGEFIKKSKEIHGDRYDYSKVDYKTRKDKIIIVCPIHGDFETTPEVHLKGCNCPKCSLGG